MCDQESAKKVNNHGAQDIFLSKTKSPDVTIEMEATKESKIELSKEYTENEGPTDVTEKQTLEEIDLSDICVDNANIDIDKKYSVKDLKVNIEKSLPNSNFIALQVFDTYYEQQEPSQTPHRQPYSTFGGDYGGDLSSSDPESRRRFIKLVFTIVLLMIIVTAIVIAWFMMTESIRFMFSRHHRVFYLIGVGLLLIAHYSMYFSSCARVAPCNIIFLLIAIAAYCLMAGNVTVRYKTHIIFYGVLATAACVFICLLLACGSFDFTSWLIYVVVIGAVFSVIVTILFVVYLITHQLPKPLHIAILIIGTILQVVTLIIELQMVLGGKSVELSEDDYALGAFMLYTSIMTLFMNMTRLFGFTE